MRTIRKFARALLFLLIPCATIADDRMAEVTAEFERQNFQAALELLDDRLADDPRFARYRALSLYYLPDHASALPWLRQAHAADPEDREILTALADALRTRGRLEEADRHADRLITAGHAQPGHLLKGRIAEERDEPEQAAEHYRAAMDGPERRTAQQAARALTDLHHRQGRHELAANVAERALGLELDPLTAAHFEGMRPPRPPEPDPLGLRLGYRLEYDDNVPQVPGDAGLFGVSNESGFRHVLTGDLTYTRPVAPRMSLFAEAYVYQSLHQDSDLSDFNFTRISGLAGAGGNWGRGGWRVPVELSWEALDGSRLRTTVAALPGVYYQPREGWLLHFFTRLSHTDFASPIRPSEDQGGDAWRVGIFLFAKPFAGLQLRLLADYGTDNADGNNWELDEWRVYSLAEYRINSRLTAGVGFQYRERDFDNVHDVFLRARDDEILEGFAHLSWHFDENWRLRAQYSYQRQDSSIPAFEFTRNVVSLGLSWEF